MTPVIVGTRLLATDLLSNTDFEKSEVFIYEYNVNGAVGFIINRVFNRKLNELAEFANSKPIDLYDGGPVDREHLFVLHRKPGLITGGTHITDSIYFGGDFAQIIGLLNSGQLPENDIRIFIGYCGWDRGELEEEIAEGSWQIMNTDSEELFNSRTHFL